MVLVFHVYRDNIIMPADCSVNHFAEVRTEAMTDRTYYLAYNWSTVRSTTVLGSGTNIGLRRG